MSLVYDRSKSALEEYLSKKASEKARADYLSNRFDPSVPDDFNPPLKRSDDVKDEKDVYRSYERYADVYRSYYESMPKQLCAERVQAIEARARKQAGDDFYEILNKYHYRCDDCLVIDSFIITQEGIEALLKLLNSDICPLESESDAIFFKKAYKDSLRRRTEDAIKKCKEAAERYKKRKKAAILFWAVIIILGLLGAYIVDLIKR